MAMKRELRSGKAGCASSRLAACVLAALLAGCTSGNIPLRNFSNAGMLATLAVTPNADIEQTYYLGSFDPQDQVPPAVYRIRVRGQSSVLNATRFASGWVPAAVVDGLTGSIAFKDKSDTLSVSTDGGLSDKLKVGRGMIMFGPEGFREAPRDHRLVIIMGSNPEQVEQAFSSALGSVALAKFGRSGAGLDREVLDLLLELSNEKEELRVLQHAAQQGDGK